MRLTSVPTTIFTHTQFKLPTISQTRPYAIFGIGDAPPDWSRLANMRTTVSDMATAAKSTVNDSKDELVKLGAQEAVKALQISQNMVRECNADNVTTTVTFTAGIIQISFSSSSGKISKAEM